MVIDILGTSCKPIYRCTRYCQCNLKEVLLDETKQEIVFLDDIAIRPQSLSSPLCESFEFVHSVDYRVKSM